MISCKKGLISLLALAMTLPLWANSTTGYQTPPKKLAALVDAPRLPYASVSPDRKMTVMISVPEMPSLEMISRQELKLAGVRFNPHNLGPSRFFGYEGASLLTFGETEERALEGLEYNVLKVSWAPDSKHLALLLAAPESLQVWVVAVADGKARRLGNVALNATLSWGGDLEWLSDNQTLVCLARPDVIGTPPAPKRVPSGPNVQESTGTKAPVRTYQDLLENPDDEAAFEHYMLSQVTLISLDGKVRRLGEPGLYANVEASPDGKLLLVEQLHRPFSYLVPYRRFPRSVQIWDLQGRLVHTVTDMPLAENLPKGFDSVRTGPRSISWRADADAELVWVEALDEGDANKEAEWRDRVITQAAPFQAEPTRLIDLGMRFRSATWGNGDLALIEEGMWSSRKTRTWAISPDQPEQDATLVFDRSMEDRYSDPGRALTLRDERGQSLLNITGDGKLLYSGMGASEEGNIPFLDRRDVRSGEVKRVWSSQAPYYERVMSTLDREGTRLILRRESKTEPPNYYLSDNGALMPITKMPHPTPELAGVQKELITYKRNDGVQLSATLYLPPGYKSEDGPLPMLMWAYPREFKSASAASQIQDSPYAFARISYWGPLPYLSMGYAILDGPTMPIVGEGESEPNDNFRKQLVASASAAIDEVVRRGVADRDRIAIGGHSYGAFMVGNLLAHSDLFRAGIARSGAYNRTLTPFGFQAEERNFWEASDVYGNMSPFFHAEKINEPILLIHGEEDSNSGTFPIQSQRMFHAIKGLGGKVRLVMLPKESHGYRARESMLHVLWEQLQWLDKYVKHAEPREQTPKNPT